MVTLYKKPPNSLEEPEPKNHPTGPYSLQLIPDGDRAHIPFRLSELKKIFLKI
jgi:hypothetical protein